MGSIGHGVFWLGAVGFLASWFVGLCFLAGLWAKRHGHGRLRWSEVKLRGDLRGAHPAAPYLRGFLWSALAAICCWCTTLVVGLWSGVLH